MTLQAHFLQHLHTALDGGDLPEAEATLDNLLLIARTSGPEWTFDERETLTWLFGLFSNECWTQ